MEGILKSYSETDHNHIIEITYNWQNIWQLPYIGFFRVCLLLLGVLLLLLLLFFSCHMGFIIQF